MIAAVRAASERTASIYRFTVNGEPMEILAPGGRRLLDVLRFDLRLTGTKEGCGEGECGACSVLLDDVLVDSCLVPLCQVDGRAVRTIEGVGGLDPLAPLQAAILDAGGVQCGFCIPGMVLAGTAFLETSGPWTPAAARQAIAGNLCRCTGYVGIVDGIVAAADAGATTAGNAPVLQRPAPASPSGQPLPRPPVPGPSLPRPTLDLGDPVSATPRTLADACALLAAGGWLPVAGGTDVLVARSVGASAQAPYLDLSALHELRGIRIAGDHLVLGAATTFADIEASPLIAEHVPVLAEMAAQFGSPQIRNRATIGGNVATASPAGDSLPLLLALDARVVAGSARGERTIAADDLFVGYRRTALAPDELIVRIEIPLSGRRRAVFRKVGRRSAVAISVVSLAVAWRPGPDGRMRDVRVALGSVAPTPVRAPRAEALLEGALPSPALAAAAGATLASEIAPIDDVRGSASYRRTVADRMLARLVRESVGEP